VTQRVSVPNSYNQLNMTKAKGIHAPSMTSMALEQFSGNKEAEEVLCGTCSVAYIGQCSLEFLYTYYLWTARAAGSDTVCVKFHGIFGSNSILHCRPRHPFTFCFWPWSCIRMWLRKPTKNLMQSSGGIDCRTSPINLLFHIFPR
jgi:hypothetical protein